MTMSSDHKDHDPLEGLFAQARAEPAAPGDDFMARLMADAERDQPAPLTPASKTAETRPRAGFLARWVALLGGAVAVAGIGTAAMAGLVIGYVQPDPLWTLADGLGLAQAGESLDLLPAFDSLLTEEDPT